MPDVRGCAAALLVLALAGGAPIPVRANHEPTLKEVLARAADYVARLHTQLSSIATEELYEQEVVQLSERGRPHISRRTLRSDLLLVRRPGERRYIEFRDVFEVDGEAVRDRQERLTALFRDPTPAGTERLKRIIDESARYNIGGLFRNINTPMLTLSFLERERQPRFRFRRASWGQPSPPGRSSPPAETGSPVFRATTEMWVLEFSEKDRPTLIKTPENRSFPARGRLWVDPRSGALLMSELVMQNDRVDALITVSYQSEPLLGFFVPVEMRERYRTRAEVVWGSARYRWGLSPFSC